jgi:hypothetical protein
VIRAETTTVYKAGGRRFLTLRAAVNKAVRDRLRDKCECDYCDHPEMPGCPTEDLPCKYHDNSERAQKIRRRLGRLYIAAFRQSKDAA